MQINIFDRNINSNIKNKNSFSGTKSVAEKIVKKSGLPAIMLASAGMFLCLNTASAKNTSLTFPNNMVEQPVPKDKTNTTVTKTISPKIMPNFRQGSSVGNCVGVSILKSFTRNDIGLEYLNSIVDKNDKNDYIVKLPDKDSIRVENSIINKYEAVVGNDYAEAIIFALYKDAKNLDDAGNWKQGEFTDPAQISLSDRGTFVRLTGLEPNCSHGSDKDLKNLEAAINAGEHFMITTSFKEGAEKVSNNKAFPKHEFELISVDTKNNKVKIANPWYDDDSKMFEMNIEDFRNFNAGMNILGIKKDEKTGKISFYNPETIGTKPGESDYEDYFNFISYEPTAKDINEYFSKENYKDVDNNVFTLSFWNKFDYKGYEKYVESRGSRILISTDSLKADMPTYSMLKSERYTPIGLLKQYMLNNTIPTFKHQELNENKEELKNWLNAEAGDVRFDIQSKHYKDSIQERALKKEREIAEKKRLEEEARIKAEEAKKLEEQARLEKTITELKSLTFDYRPEGFVKGVVPSDLAQYRKLYPNATYNKETRKMYYKDIFGKNAIISFDKAGHVLSEVFKKDGKIEEERKYSYPSEGVKIYAEKGWTSQEIYNEKGELLATCTYNLAKNSSVVSEYITAPNGENYIKSRIARAVDRYRIVEVGNQEHEYDFAEDGSIKEERIYMMKKTRDGYIREDEEKRVHLANGVQKYYWNGEFKATYSSDGFRDVNGNKINHFVLSSLPSKVEE